MRSHTYITNMFATGIIGMHVNKALYTVSYMCVTTGAAGILFAGIYTLVRPEPSSPT